MPTTPNSPSMRIFLSEENAQYKKKFKQLAAEAEASMSARMALLMQKDIEYWDQTGEVFPWEKVSVEDLKKCPKSIKD